MWTTTKKGVSEIELDSPAERGDSKEKVYIDLVSEVCNRYILKKKKMESLSPAANLPHIIISIRKPECLWSLLWLIIQETGTSKLDGLINIVITFLMKTDISIQN